MDTGAAVAVEAPHQKCASVFGEVDQHGLWYIQTAKSCEVMGDLFPSTHIYIVMFGRELGDPQVAFRVKNSGLRSCATKGRTGLDELVDPLLLETGFIVFELTGSFFQCSQAGPRRSWSFRVIGKERAVFVQLEADGSHAGFIVYPHQEVAAKEFPGFPAFLLCQYPFPASHQQTAPAVGGRVGEETEHIFFTCRVLPSNIQLKVWVEMKIV